MGTQSAVKTVKGTSDTLLMRPSTRRIAPSGRMAPLPLASSSALTTFAPWTCSPAVRRRKFIPRTRQTSLLSRRTSPLFFLPNPRSRGRAVKAWRGRPASPRRGKTRYLIPCSSLQTIFSVSIPSFKDRVQGIKGKTLCKKLRNHGGHIGSKFLFLL